MKSTGTKAQNFSNTTQYTPISPQNFNRKTSPLKGHNKTLRDIRRTNEISHRSSVSATEISH